MKNYKLNETTIGTAKVIVDILPKGKCIPNVKINPTSITIHNTGNIGAPAKNNHNYMKNCNRNGDRIASWHFTCDDKEIYQAQSTNYKCYHAGCTSGNNTSIGIEICMFNDKERQRKAYENAIALVKILMAYHGFNINQVKQHYNWTKKDCPTWLRSGKFGYTWNWFIGRCKGTVSQPQEIITENKFKNGDYNKTYEVKSSDGVLSVRASRPINGQLGEKLGELKHGDKVFIGYVLNNWGGVIFNGKQGFVNMKYLVEVVEEQIFKPYVVRIIVDELNVRAGVGTSYAVVTVIKKGDAFTIVEEKNGWGKLKSGIGWISLNSKYVQKL